ncbi:MAG TPA: heterodisulfide reductase-related iron-sulfur binding cluster, partial [Thermoplasmata archaeon]|nr:heterodisulfide reductase-related iron-sulfur binding cluster [Thermoplasmata archaeon]
MKLAYYPGCVAQESGKELDMSTRWVAQKVGIELVEFPNFSCCGSGFIDEANAALNIALNARNLAIAEKAGLDLLTICSTCQGMLTLANRRLEEPAMRARVDGALKQIGVEYRRSTK